VLKPFLTANWRYLAMLNYRIEPELLAPYVPAGTELDFHHGETFISVVGLLFYQTTVIGLPIPRHRNFEEVNLRFYVRKKSADVWRRGVVFIREFVPRIAVAVTARVFYGEPYQVLPMRSEVIDRDGNVDVRYEWRRKSRWEFIALRAQGEAEIIGVGSHEEFIAEHYWGYTNRGARTSEYRIEHPRWKIWRATAYEFSAEIASLYGERFAPVLSAQPASAFIADGSFVTVFQREPES
jgi:uncharacterized protein YqjF (DUF2071 family)